METHPPDLLSPPTPHTGPSLRVGLQPGASAHHLRGHSWVHTGRSRSPLSSAPKSLFSLLPLERRSLPAWGPAPLGGSPLLPSLLALPGSRHLPNLPTLRPGAPAPALCSRGLACALRSPSAEWLPSSAPGPSSLPSPPPCPLHAPLQKVAHTPDSSAAASSAHLGVSAA